MRLYPKKKGKLRHVGFQAEFKVDQHENICWKFSYIHPLAKLKSILSFYFLLIAYTRINNDLTDNNFIDVYFSYSACPTNHTSYLFIQFESIGMLCKTTVSMVRPSPKPNKTPQSNSSPVVVFFVPSTISFSTSPK